MNIRGVRSFASDNEQRIEFFKPLTVIVGPNGCGKTSTIECLRYATTGALPPGSQSGRAFVHDPKVEGETEVKASVKLLFETADKTKRYMAIRNMQLTQKKKTSQFKQIDGRCFFLLHIYGPKHIYIKMYLTYNSLSFSFLYIYLSLSLSPLFVCVVCVGWCALPSSPPSSPSPPYLSLLCSFNNKTQCSISNALVLFFSLEHRCLTSF